MKESIEHLSKAKKGLSYLLLSHKLLYYSQGDS